MANIGNSNLSIGQILSGKEPLENLLTCADNLDGMPGTRGSLSGLDRFGEPLGGVDMHPTLLSGFGGLESLLIKELPEPEPR